MTPGRIFGKTSASPKFIFIQIMTLVSFFQVSFLLAAIIIHGIFSWKILLASTVLDAESFSIFDSVGCQLWLALALSSFAQAHAVKIVAERSRKVLDFVLTTHIVNLLLTWIFGNSFPTTFGWWMAFGFSAIGTTIGGEFLCRNEERRVIVYE